MSTLLFFIFIYLFIYNLVGGLSLRKTPLFFLTTGTSFTNIFTNTHTHRYFYVQLNPESVPCCPYITPILSLGLI